MIFDALRAHLRDDGDVTRINQAIVAARRIVQASTQAMSIDNLVDALEDEMLSMVAKAAIVRAIHQAEASCLCARWVRDNPGTLDLTGFHDHWYSSLSKLLFESLRLSNVDAIFDNLEIINFNYDRCLEAYLPHSISNYYGIPLDAAAALLDHLPMHRPYGIVGDPKTVGLGSVTTRQLMQVATGIRTFTEQVEDETALAAIKNSLASADRIVFLGFAFHRQNLKLLEVGVQDHTEVLGTAFKVSDSDRAVIHEELIRTFGMDWGPAAPGKIELSGAKCAEFFSDNWRTLTAEPRDF